MEDLHIIFEDPEAYSVPAKQQRRSPLATACEYCRAKKIKCQMNSLSPICRACATSKRTCHSPAQAQHPASPTAEMACHSEPLGSQRSDYAMQIQSQGTPQILPVLNNIAQVNCAELNSGSHSSMGMPTERAKFSDDFETPQVLHCTSQISSRFAGEYCYIDGYTATSCTFRPLHGLPTVRRPVIGRRSSLSDFIFDPPRPALPSSKNMQEGMSLFFDNMGSHFPFLHRERVIRSMNDLTLPAGLANCIVGLSLRFSSSEAPGMSNYLLGEPFIEMAKEIIMPVVRIPSLETLHALILLAWCEYGRAHEKDVLVFREYAVSMALSMGIGTYAILLRVSRDEEMDIRSTWWGVVTLDILVSWATGTATMLSPENYFPAPISALRSTEILNTLLHERLYDLLALRNRLLGTLYSSIVLGRNENHIRDFRSILALLADLKSRLPQNLTLDNSRNDKRGDYHPLVAFFHFALESLITMAGCQPLSHRGIHECSCQVKTVTEAITDLINLFESVDSRMILASPFLNLPLILVSQTLFTHFYGENGWGEPGDPLPVLAEVALRVYVGALVIHQKLWRNPRGSESMYERMSSCLPPMKGHA